MDINFDPDWDDPDNHDSDRSENAVRWIVEQIGSGWQLDYDYSKGALGQAIYHDHPVTVLKGIHSDSRGYHITINVEGVYVHGNHKEMFHIYLKEGMVQGNTFVWCPSEAR